MEMLPLFAILMPHGSRTSAGYHETRDSNGKIVSDTADPGLLIRKK
jgi:hypothetical protein